VSIFWKTTPYNKIFKILFRTFLAPHRWTSLCSSVVKFVRREIGEIVRYLHEQKRLPPKLSLLRELRSKYVGASPDHLAHTVPNFIQMGSLLAEL